MSPDSPGFGDFTVPLLPGFGDFDARRLLPSMPFPGDLGASSNNVPLFSTSALFRRCLGDLDDGRFSELDGFGDFPISPVEARRDGVLGDLE